MSDYVTNNTFSCGDPTALVSYLYDECEPRDRDAMAAHLASCPACTAELDSLRATKRMLPAWSPPEAALGFQITSGEASARVLRPARWWQRPLPAWAQAAAAIAIFAAGLLAGRVPGAGSPDVTRAENVAPASDAEPVPSAAAPAGAGRQAAVAVPAGESVGSVSRDDLTRLERDLRAELARIEQAQRAADAQLLRASAASGNAAPPQAPILDRVQALIEESERRQRGELIVAMGQVLSDAETYRRRELAPVRRTVEGLGREVVTNRSSVAALAEAISVHAGVQRISTGR